MVKPTQPPPTSTQPSDPQNSTKPRTPAGIRGSVDVGQRVTLPAFRQPVHTLRRVRVLLTVARTRWMLGSKRRLVIFFDHGRLLPKPGFLAQMSQTAATGVLLESRVERARSKRATGKEYPTQPLGHESADGGHH